MQPKRQRRRQNAGRGGKYHVCPCGAPGGWCFADRKDFACPGCGKKIGPAPSEDCKPDPVTALGPKAVVDALRHLLAGHPEFLYLATAAEAALAGQDEKGKDAPAQLDQRKACLLSYQHLQAERRSMDRMERDVVKFAGQVQAAQKQLKEAEDRKKEKEAELLALRVQYEEKFAVHKGKFGEGCPIDFDSSDGTKGTEEQPDVRPDAGPKEGKARMDVDEEAVPGGAPVPGPSGPAAEAGAKASRARAETSEALDRAKRLKGQDGKAAPLLTQEEADALKKQLDEAVSACAGAAVGVEAEPEDGEEADTKKSG